MTEEEVLRLQVGDTLLRVNPPLPTSFPAGLTAKIIDIHKRGTRHVYVHLEFWHKGIKHSWKSSHDSLLQYFELQKNEDQQFLDNLYGGGSA